jgi:uncharacterized protein (TIGR02594 family)
MSNPLPQQYRWLTGLGLLPRMVSEALVEFGDIETPGPGNNPTIMGWAREVGVGSVYTADSVPWCGLFMAVVAKRAGKELPASPLWALSWAKFGDDEGQPRLGDVLTFVRKGGGHVALYIGEDKAAYHVLGGNQGDSVSFTRIDKARLYRVRRPHYTVAPATARPFVLEATGGLSDNEA